jgi:all-trans-retinol 13,14-reductase
MSGGYSVVQLFLGLQEDPRRLGFQGENHWIYTGYDHDAMFDGRGGLHTGKPTGLFLSFPSLNDPQARAHTAVIVSHLPYAGLEHWGEQPWLRRDGEYQDMKEHLTEGLMDLVESIYPGFKQLVCYRELSTPLTFEHFTNHPGGAIYGLPMTTERFRKNWLGVRTPIQNLYLAGADVCSPGIIGAMMGGVAAAACQMGGFGLGRIIAAAQGFSASTRGVKEKPNRAA